MKNKGNYNIEEKNEAISLIALIVTIVILFILSGIIISTFTRENGLFVKIKQAKILQKQTEIEERVKLIILEYEIEKEHGKELIEFLTDKKGNGIDDFIDNNDGTFDIIISGYTITINEENLSTTKPQVIEDIMVGCLAKEFVNNKIQVLIRVKSNNNTIKEVRLINGVKVQANNQKEIAFDQIIDANTEYKIEVELTNGTVKTQSIEYEDKEAPTASIDIENKIIFNNESIKANINLKDNKSGVNISECKWGVTKDNNELGTSDKSLYTGGTFSSTTQTLKIENLVEPGEYYIHLLLKDNVGNTKEVISEKIEIKEGYEISTPEELQAIGNNLTANYYITKDIDMAGFEFTPIPGSFKGMLDGRGTYNI